MGGNDLLKSVNNFFMIIPIDRRAILIVDVILFIQTGPVRGRQGSHIFLFTTDCVNLDDSTDANCTGRWFHYIPGQGPQLDNTVTRTCKSKKNLL